MCERVCAWTRARTHHFLGAVSAESAEGEPTLEQAEAETEARSGVRGVGPLFASGSQMTRVAPGLQMPNNVHLPPFLLGCYNA